jgi:hypothetical protein
MTLRFATRTVIVTTTIRLFWEGFDSYATYQSHFGSRVAGLQSEDRDGSLIPLQVLGYYLLADFVINFFFESRLIFSGFEHKTTTDLK